jgi:serine/threonine protein kinase
MTSDQLLEASSNDAIFPRRFDQYVLVTRLGQGGMGRVYLALTSTADLCVIKRFGNPEADIPARFLKENQARFRREADLTKTLAHPCIARTWCSVHQGNDSYLVQEFVDGATLEYLLSSAAAAGRRVPIALAAYVVCQIADALMYVHDFRGLGLIHRDLTATNVMISKTGAVKIIDFGIAKATLTDEQLTQPHIVVGKLLWTAPEVVHGEKPDRRTDLFALGLLFWFLLSGENPADHRENPDTPLPPPSTFNPDVPSDLDAIVLKAIHAHPNRRFQTAADFRLAVARFFPSGYQGSEELASLIKQYRLTSHDQFFTELVDRARPLLKTGGTRKHNGIRVAAVLALVLLAGGAFLAIRQIDHPAASQPEPQPLQLPIPDPSPPPRTPPPAAALPQPPIPATPPSAAQLPATTASLSQPPSSRPSASFRSARPPKAKSHTTSEPQPQRDAQDPEALLNSAMHAITTGEGSKALHLARASVDIRPSADAYILIGRLLSSSDPPAARAALESALRLDPGNQQATRLLKILNRTQF